MTEPKGAPVIEWTEQGVFRPVEECPSCPDECPDDALRPGDPAYDPADEDCS